MGLRDPRKDRQADHLSRNALGDRMLLCAASQLREARLKVQWHRIEHAVTDPRFRQMFAKPIAPAILDPNRVLVIHMASARQLRRRHYRERTEHRVIACRRGAPLVVPLLQIRQLDL